MIVLNMSFHVDGGVSERFLAWARSVYVPAAGESGLFSGVRLMHLLWPLEDGVKAYVVHHECVDASAIGKWREGRGAELLDGLGELMGDGVVYFSSIMRSDV